MAHHDHDHEHNHERDAAAQVPYTARVITVSDRCAAGKRVDSAGPALVAQLAAAGFDVDPHVVVEPDDAGRIAHAIREAARADVALCVTCGGTGLGPRDVTPEATLTVCDRMVPGLGELMRSRSAGITDHAWVSRGTAGTLARTLVVNVPGSPKGATENLGFVLDPIRHGLKMLRAEGPADCAAERAASEAASLASRPCVLFDFDGTLADTKRCIVETATEVLLGFGLTREQIGDAGRLVGPPFPAAFTLVYGLSEEDAAEVTRRYRAIYFKLGPESHPLFAGIRELLDELRAQGRRLGIVSSKNYKLIDAALADTGIEGLFDAVVSSRDPKDVGKQALVTRALEELGCVPHDAVMVGDRFYDIEGACACGVASLGVYLGNTAEDGELERAGATAVARSVAEMRAILLG